MSVYLGELGRLVELKCPASQSVSVEDGATFETTLEGRVKASVRPRVGSRVWSLSVSEATTPADHATLYSFINGEWGAGPFVWVSADAAVTNLLSPSASACMDMRPGNSAVHPGGPMNLGAAGWAGRSIAADSTGGVLPEIYFGTADIPVLPGVPVTGSAWLSGVDSVIRLYWYRAGSLSPMGNTTSGRTGESGVHRRTVTGFPPEGAAFCRLVASGATRATRPAVTWTRQAFDWAPGEGCPKAVIHRASKSPSMVSDDPRGGRYASASYTVTEVG